MPPFLEAALLPFQREGVRFGLGCGGKCMLADEVRCAVPCLPGHGGHAGCILDGQTTRLLGCPRCLKGGMPSCSAAQLSCCTQFLLPPLLLLQMGVGKTVQAIALASCYQVGRRQNGSWREKKGTLCVHQELGAAAASRYRTGWSTRDLHSTVSNAGRLRGSAVPGCP